MADSGMSVSPYWELTFDTSGDVDPPERDHLLAQVTEQGVRDLVVFAHGWNEDRSAATALYRRFFAPFPGLAPKAHLGYVGVVWPSMRFSDEPIPDFPKSVVATEAAPGPALDQDTRRGLLVAFPDRADVIDQVARLLDERPDGDAGLTEFGRLVRLLLDGAGRTAADTDEDGEPTVFTEEPATACAEFAGALAAVAAPGGTEGFSLPNPWEGAKELLRQAAYYQMKGRAGTIGEHGLGPLLGKLAAKAPGVRVHLVGHSFGGRLVAFALRGLPGQARPVKSLTLLEGAFSHYVFADQLPDDPHKSGALKDQQRRIDGPLVCCHSHFDAALGTFYPLASRLAGTTGPAWATRSRPCWAPGGARWAMTGCRRYRARPGWIWPAPWRAGCPRRGV